MNKKEQSEGTITLVELSDKGKLWLKNSAEEERVRAAEVFHNMLSVFEELNLSPAEDEDFDPVIFISNAVAQMNDVLSKQIDEVIHHPEFSALEGKWSGLAHLIRNTETSKHLAIKVLNVSKTELTRDLTRAIEFDQSRLFKIIYEAEYGTFGGSPFSFMVYDDYFTSSNIDVDVLKKLSSVMAAAHCPVISSVNPSVFNIESYKDINKSRDISKVFQTADKISWNAFRKTQDSKYVALTLPRVMSRAPYSVENNPCTGIDYNETVNYNNDNHFSWMNAAYALAVRITSAFSLYGWTAAIRGVEGGGMCNDLPVYVHVKEEGDIAIKCPTEVSITDRREKELSDLGFVCLCHCKGTNKAAFFSVQTCHVPDLYDSFAATANARMSVSLPYLLTSSRFVQYMVVMLRNKIGSFQSGDDIQNYLQTWLARYVLSNPTASQELKASMPLKDASVQVVDNPGAVGSYSAIVHVMPHFQFEDINLSMRLVSRLPSAGQ